MKGRRVQTCQTLGNVLGQNNGQNGYGTEVIARIIRNAKCKTDSAKQDKEKGLTIIPYYGATSGKIGHPLKKYGDETSHKNRACFKSSQL